MQKRDILSISNYEAEAGLSEMIGMRRDKYPDMVAATCFSLWSSGEH
jgi:hypothetical protein